ncbi:glycosyltransferase family 2 protein [Candidatus Woesebacteria bacterium]|nr:glycosyltransferase family 2 protein [Candidatus Woesebacteria bacterium]
MIDNSDGQAGFGEGCNRGAEQAHGEGVLFVNPDVYVTTDAIDALYEFLGAHPQIGLIGPQILDETGAVQITSSTVPTALEAAIVYSWLGNLSAFGSYREHYRLWGFDHRSSRPVPSVSGSCFMMRREEFLAIGGCDENMFLYFEEFDLAQRVRSQLDKEVYFLATASVVHFGQHSTKQLPSVAHHFRASRRYWLQKHYGFSGAIANFWIRLWEK